MSEVFTNDQAAERLGISPNTIRTWKSRKSAELVENQHWFSQDGQNFWTPAGLDALATIKNTIRIKATETGETGTVSETGFETGWDTSETAADLTIRYTPIIEAVSDAVAHQVVNRIDSTVMGKVRLHLSKPVTTTERVQLLSSLGLKPANPELLLQGNSTNYLPQGDN